MLGGSAGAASKVERRRGQRVGESVTLLDDRVWSFYSWLVAQSGREQ